VRSKIATLYKDRKSKRRRRYTFALTPILKKLLSFEIPSYHQNHRSVIGKVSVTNYLEKGPHRDYETAVCSPLALTILKKIFKD
jgi:hypothetical protein